MCLPKAELKTKNSLDSLEKNVFTLVAVTCTFDKPRRKTSESWGLQEPIFNGEVFEGKNLKGEDPDIQGGAIFGFQRGDQKNKPTAEGVELV